MPGKRAALSRLLLAAGVTLLVRRLSRARKLVALTYHRVDDAPRDGFPLDREVLDATPAEFAAQMEFVASHFTTVTPSDVALMLAGRRPWPRFPIMITFDDGYLDNLKWALPILHRHGLRAAFFVAADYIERRKPFWWDRVCYSLLRTEKESFTLQYPQKVTVTVGGEPMRRRAANKINAILKNTSDLDLPRFENELFEATRVETPDLELAEKHLLTWDHVRQISSGGMEIGSHTMTHRTLSHLSEKVLRQELNESREMLEARVKVPVRALSYPAGYVKPHLYAAVGDCGYETAFTYMQKAQLIERLSPLSIPRQAVDHATPLHLFQCRLMLPGIFR